MKQSIVLLLGVSALSGAVPRKAAMPDGKGFSTPNAAVQALANAANTDNVQELTQILGPSAKRILSTSDPVADREIRRTFAARAAQKTRVIPYRGRQNEKTVLVGNNEWPLPIPLVRVNGKWYFDTARGKQEILRRRIGSNELDAIEVCRGYVESQRDYAQSHRTAAGVPYYAQKIISSPGQQDGLYWPGAPGQEQSPIGKIVARAIAAGYTTRGAPYRGYYFRVLTAQGPHAGGPPMSYIDNNGAMTKGFALIAWPADYGSTGIMTFQVNQAGIVYQKDLGPQTAKIVAGYTAYDPDNSWSPVSDSFSTRSGFAGHSLSMLMAIPNLAPSTYADA